jgi:putative hydrolase of the HAD superfamily
MAVRLAWSGGREGVHLPNEIEERIETEFVAAIEATPPLRTGVREGLSELQSIGCPVLVLTEGDRQRVLQTAQWHGLTSFDRVIEARKSQRLFKRVLALTGQPSRVFMVGDQLKSDIRPAKEAGLRTIYFPGGFKPRWEPDESIVRPDYQVASFADVPRIILAECSNEARGPDSAHT